MTADDRISALCEIKDTERLTPEHYLAIRSDGLTFMACLSAVTEAPELIQQIDRLYGTCLLSRSSPIETMIDKATGKRDDDMQTVLRFVWNSIFIRCPPARPATAEESK